MNTTMMLQRQVEVAGALRSPPKTAQELMHARDVIKALALFVTQISRLATKLQLPLENVFQCLLQIGLGGASSGVSFDKQHRQGNVPMHQAKVLDRNTALNAQRVEPRIRELVDDAIVTQYTLHCNELRTLLRMKVEDGNDLSMARKLVSLAEEYLDHIHHLSEGNPDTMMHLYLADDERAIRGILESSGAGAAAAAVGGGGVHGAASAHDTCKPLPTNLVKGVVEECRGTLDSIKEEFARRQRALMNLKSWLQNAEQASIDAHAQPLVAALHEPLKAQLGDKRSVVCRLACDIVAILLLRCPMDALLPHQKMRDVLVSWIEVLLKGVHVTVAAIAEATDLTTRLATLACRGAHFLLHVFTAALVKATQPELRRKLLNYLMMGVVVSVQSPAELASTVPIVVKMCSTSEEACRHVARMVLIALQSKGCAIAALDPKIERCVEQERQGVLDAIAGPMDALEVIALKYNEASRATCMADLLSPPATVAPHPSSHSSPQRVSPHAPVASTVRHELGHTSIASVAPPFVGTQVDLDSFSMTAPSALREIDRSAPAAQRCAKVQLGSSASKSGVSLAGNRPPEATTHLPDITNHLKTSPVHSSSTLSAIPLSLRSLSSVGSYTGHGPLGATSTGAASPSASLSASLSSSLKRRMSQRSDSTTSFS